MIGLITTALVGLFTIVVEFNYMRTEIEKINDKLDIARYERDQMHRDEIQVLERTLLLKKIENITNDK